MVKRKNVSTNANVLDMRYLKRSRPRDNALTSSDIAVPGTPLASQSVLGVSLNAISEHQRVALMISRIIRLLDRFSNFF